jgi:hypothetical protein
MEKFKFLDDVSSILFSIIWYYSKFGGPSFKFPNPIRDGGVWDDHEGWVCLPIQCDVP